MFGIRLWSRFGSFRDPLTITQNLTLPFPPKTTIGGMMAAILGIDYNEYFNDPDFFGFKYSVVLDRPIRKKSFAQNYINDYTKTSETKLNTSLGYFLSSSELRSLLDEKENTDVSSLSKKEAAAFSKIDAKIAKTKETTDKKYRSYAKQVSEKFTSPKPIFRELLIDPGYVVFVKNFKHEAAITEHLQKHFSEFTLYMGNSEFAANYAYLPCSCEEYTADTADSFTASPDLLLFEAGKKYISMYSATRTETNRTYGDYRKLVISDRRIKFRTERPLTKIVTEGNSYNCEFV